MEPGSSVLRRAHYTSKYSEGLKISICDHFGVGHNLQHCVKMPPNHMNKLIKIWGLPQDDSPAIASNLIKWYVFIFNLVAGQIMKISVVLEFPIVSNY